MFYRCLTVVRGGVTLGYQIKQLVDQGLYESEWCSVVPPGAEVVWAEGVDTTWVSKQWNYNDWEIVMALSHVHYIPCLDNGKYVTITASADIVEADVSVDTTWMSKQQNIT